MFEFGGHAHMVGLRLHSDWVKNGKLVPFFDQNIVNNDDVIYGHCVDGQKFYVVEKGSKIGQVFRFGLSLNAASQEMFIDTKKSCNNIIMPKGRRKNKPRNDPLHDIHGP